MENPMPNAQEFLSQQPIYILLVNGPPDAGKTDLALTFPDNYVIACDPVGLEFLKLKRQRSVELAKNLVHVEEFNSEQSSELKDAFKRTNDANDRSSIYGILAHAKQLAKEGKVKTITLDGLTYFMQMKWAQVKADKNNESNKFAAFDALSIFLNEFIRADFLTMATRMRLNVIMTCHIQRESDEAMEKKTVKDSDIAPRIIGSFRNTIDGLPGAVIYLEHKVGKDKDGNQKLDYWAYCQKTPAMQTIIQAKNKYGLPAKLNITDKNFYNILVETALNGGVKPKP
jgi:AAA domain